MTDEEKHAILSELAVHVQIKPHPKPCGECSHPKLPMEFIRFHLCLRCDAFFGCRDPYCKGGVRWNRCSACATLEGRVCSVCHSMDFTDHGGVNRTTCNDCGNAVFTR
jgi:hypothetical protein